MTKKVQNWRTKIQQARFLENKKLKKNTSDWFSTAEDAENWVTEKEDNIKIKIICLMEPQECGGNVSTEYCGIL